MQDQMSTTKKESGDGPNSTMALLQNELTKKWEREQAEKEREERLTDVRLGPEQRQTLADDKAFYDFYGGVEEGDILEWDDGEVNEVIAVVPAHQTRVEDEPEGEIIHYRVTEEIPDADSYSIVNHVGDQNDMRDYDIGQALARGTVTVRDGEK